MPGGESHWLVNIFKGLVVLALLAFIVLVIIVLIRLINGNWIRKGGPAIAIRALVYTQVLETMNTEKDEYIDTLVPKHFLNNYFLEGEPGDVLMKSKYFTPGMEITFTNSTGAACDLIVDTEEPIPLPTGLKKFIIDAENELQAMAAT